MKIGKIILTAVMVFALVAGFASASCTSVGNLPEHVQQLDYEEATEKINNPDQGFYRPIYVKMTEEGATYNKNIINASTQLYHLRVDISAFSKAVNGKADKQIPKASLNGFKGLLSLLKEKDKNAVVRFAYDPSYGGAKDKEPALNMMLSHIKQVCPIIKEYGNTVTAVEAGLIGPWGEMHSSAIANKENITPIVKAFLSGTDVTPVLVRTPKMIYDYLGITVKDIDGYEISAKEKAYRLGLYNDGYLGSATDLGTYTDRAREVEFLSRQTAHLPYGGEVVIPNSPLHDVTACLPEMNKLCLSYLNIEWNNQVIDKWKNSTYTAECGADEKYYGRTAFSYIENRLGYRFVLKKSTLKYTDKLNALGVELELENVGFGNLNRVKKVKIIIADGNGNVVFSKTVRDFKGEESFSCTVKPKLADGSYGVYMCVYGEEEEGKPLYSLRFANAGLWNDGLKANKIGVIENGVASSSATQPTRF